MDRRAEVLEFMRSCTLMVLSTVDGEGRPEAAVVGFGQTDALELVFGTSDQSRKYQNLQHDGHVAAVIGWDDGKTVQYEGVARELSGAESEVLAELYASKTPQARKFRERPDNYYFKISPTWLRYTDVKTNPQDVVELTFEMENPHGDS